MLTVTPGQARSRGVPQTDDGREHALTGEVEANYYRALAVLEARSVQTGERFMVESVHRQLLQLVDQLLQAPLPEQERELLLRQMRDLLEPPPAEIVQPEKEDQEGP